MPQGNTDRCEPVARTGLGVKLRRFPLVVLSAALKWALRQFVYRPDSLRLWAGAVATTALRDEDLRTDALLTSSPAFSCHLAGLAIKRRTGVPWVADFRDLWVGRPFREEGGALRRWLDARQEAAVVKHCDRLVLASPAWVPAFVRRYGPEVAQKLVVVTNGYEAALMDAARARVAAGAVPRPPGKVRFVLTGSMHEGESPLPLLQALAALRTANPSLADRAEVIFIGNAGGHAAVLQQAVAAGGLEGQVTFMPPCANDLCLEAQYAADWLMLFSALPHRETLRGKSFEYMATGKPILACIPPVGVQAEVLAHAGTAVVVPHGDVPALQVVLAEILGGSLSPGRADWGYIRAFDRRELAGKLAGVLNEVAKPPLHPRVRMQPTEGED